MVVKVSSRERNNVSMDIQDTRWLGVSALHASSRAWNAL